MGRPEKAYNKDGEEIKSKPTIIWKAKKPKLDPADPITGFKKISGDNTLLDILMYYASKRVSEKTIRVMCQKGALEWEMVMQMVNPESGLTYREHYDIAYAMWEIKRVEMKEEALDSEDVDIMDKYKIIRDDLRTMKEHSPASNGTQTTDAAPTFGGYEITIKKKEPDGNSTDQKQE